MAYEQMIRDGQADDHARAVAGPWSVRPATEGSVTWASGLTTLAAAVRAVREARDTGLRNLVVVSATGFEIDQSSPEWTDAEDAVDEG